MRDATGSTRLPAPDARCARWLVALLLASGAAAASNVRAQQTSDSELEALFPASEGDDPIGIDRRSRTLDEVGERPQAQAQPDNQRFGPTPPPLRVNRGEVLTALPSTREVRHRVEFTLRDGLLFARVEMELESTAESPSELRYRLAVPEGAGLSELEVCNPQGCRRGLPEPAGDGFSAYDAAVLARAPDATPAGPLPVAHAQPVRDARGSAIALRAAPLSKDAPLTLRTSWVAPAPLRGGVCRLQLPARGMDPRVAAAEVTLRTEALIDPRIAGHPAGESALLIEPWTTAELSARAPSGGALSHRNARGEVMPARCGRAGCARVRAWAAPRDPAPVELVIALDVSPSTLGPARGRLLGAVTELLSAAPPGSRVRALAFAAKAAPLIEQPMEPAEVGLAPFSRAIAQAELGAATRLDAVWKVAGPWLTERRGAPGAEGSRKKLLVIIGDGGLSELRGRVLEPLRRAGVTLSALNLDDRPARGWLLQVARRANGNVIEAGELAARAGHGGSAQALREAITGLFAEVVAPRVAVVADGKRHALGALRAGEELVWEGRARRVRLVGIRSARPTAPEPALAAALCARHMASEEPGSAFALTAVDERDLSGGSTDWPAQRAKGKCDPRGPAWRASGVSSDAAPVSLAEARACKKPEPAVAESAPAPGAGMPSSPLLGMLRQRILPVARGCFRRERAGRADHSRRAVFVFRLAEREVLSARVEGAIPEQLRSCLLSSIDTLDIPRFSGVVNVRYPLVTERVPLPQQIELSADAESALDGLFAP